MLRQIGSEQKCWLYWPHNRNPNNIAANTTADDKRGFCKVKHWSCHQHFKPSSTTAPAMRQKDDFLFNFMTNQMTAKSIISL
jgi:hypothetical protein